MLNTVNGFRLSGTVNGHPTAICLLSIGNQTPWSFKHYLKKCDGQKLVVFMCEDYCQSTS